MSVVVGTLTIDLKANTASFSQSMDKASHLTAKTANDIKRSLEKIAAIGLAMGAAVATGTAELIRGAVDAADEMGKLAQSAGTTSETLSTLGYAAKLSGIGTDQLGVGLVRLSKAAFQAQNGNVQLERIFGRLGVTVADSNGHLKDSGILMEELASKFAGVADGAGKTALATALFGKSGASLIPFLDRYGSQQASVNAEAQQFGLVLGTSTTEVAAKAHDNLIKLQEALRGVGFAVLGAVLPSLVDLSDKLIQVAKDADIPDLAKAFGAKVTTAVNLMGDGLEFAERHAEGLKITLEALAGLQIAKIALPVISDLASGGIENVGAGIAKLGISVAGLGKVAPILGEFAGWLKYTASFVGLLASEEGIASAASYVLGGAFVAMGGWTAVAIGGVAALGVELFRLRDKTITLRGNTYQLRDFWNAEWIGMGMVLKDVEGKFGEFTAYLRKEWAGFTTGMGGGRISKELGKAFGEISDAFTTMTDEMRKLWSDFTTWFSGSKIGNEIKNAFGEITTWAAKLLDVDAKLIHPLQGYIALLDEAKRRRTPPIDPRFMSTLTLFPASDKDDLNTRGLGKTKGDPYNEELKKLDLAINAQRSYLAVLDASPEKIAAVASEERARAIILELTNRLIEEGKLKVGQSLQADQQAAIMRKVAAEDSLKALVEYGKEIVGQQRSMDLGIQQARALAVANLQGDEAVRKAIVDNQVLGLTYNKLGAILAARKDLGIDGTPAQIAELNRAMKGILADTAALGAQFAAKSNIEVTGDAYKNIRDLEQQLATRKLLTAATLESLDAQRQADLQAKTSRLTEQIGATADPEAKNALVRQRDALVALTEAQWDAVDAEAALALLSPLDQYKRETDALARATDALRGLQNGSLSYGEQLQINAREQDAFNKATDETVGLLLRSGSAADGVTAFFLEMQKQAKSTASIVYDALHDAFTKISDNITQLITGGKTSFGKMFEDIGKQMLNSTIQQQLQKGLGALSASHTGLAKILGVDTAKKYDGSSPQNALWVQMVNGLGTGLQKLGEATGIAPATSKPGEGNELDDLLGMSGGKGQNQAGNQAPPSILGDLSGFFKTLFGGKSQQSGGALGGETLGLPNNLFSQPNELDDLNGDNSDSGSGSTTGFPWPTLLRRSLGSDSSDGSSNDSSSLFMGGPSGSSMAGANGTPAPKQGWFQSIAMPLLGAALKSFSKQGDSDDDSDDSDGGSGGGLSSIFGKLIPHAAGGSVSPDKAYLVGENGPEILKGASGSISSTADSKRMLSGAGSAQNHYYNIDARGTDPALTEQRVRAAIRQSHDSAVVTSIRASKEHQSRVPQR